MLRVKVDLLDGKSITNIWSETYDRDLTGKNIFKLQDEIIKQIINELVGAGAVLSKDINQKIVSSGTDDISIYECINFARGAVTPTLNPRAIECLEKAVKKAGNSYQIKIVGLDASPAGKQADLEKQIVDSPQQFPRKMAIGTVNAFFEYLKASLIFELLTNISI